MEQIWDAQVVDVYVDAQLLFDGIADALLRLRQAWHRIGAKLPRQNILDQVHPDLQLQRAIPLHARRIGNGELVQCFSHGSMLLCGVCHRLPLLIIFAAIRVTLAAGGVRTQHDFEQLLPLVHWACQSAKPSRYATRTTVLTKVGSLSLDLIHHPLKVLAHLPSLTDTPWQSRSGGRHLRYKILALRLVLQIFEGVICGRSVRLQEDPLHAWRQRSEGCIQQPITEPRMPHEAAIVPSHDEPAPSIEVQESVW